MSNESIRKMIRTARIPSFVSKETLVTLGFKQLRDIVEHKSYLLEGDNAAHRKSYFLEGSDPKSTYMACALMAKELVITGEKLFFAPILPLIGKVTMEIASGSEIEIPSDGYIVVPDIMEAERCFGSPYAVTALGAIVEYLTELQSHGGAVILGVSHRANLPPTWPPQFTTWLDFGGEWIDIS